LAPQGKIISLVKPQFESKKEEADSGKGIIRDPEIHKRVLDEIKQFAKENLSGSSLLAEKSARPQGTDGNQEFFLCWEKKTTA
jgi:23S rRNA (cytidine1920-2'-O)/16S rRNA (cytidine1409-2'-O)-methyltransferase